MDPIMIEVTTGEIPRSRIPADCSASAASIKRALRKSRYSVAVPVADDSTVSLRISFAAGPLMAEVPIIGLTPTTAAVDAFSASRIPGTARIGPMLVIGLLGQTMIFSALAIDSRTPGAGRLLSTPE